MENITNVQTIQLKIGQAFSQKIAMRQLPDPASTPFEGSDAKYLSFFADAHRNPAAHSFQFA